MRKFDVIGWCLRRRAALLLPAMIFSLSLRAQPLPPSLRCLEVKANGDVLLTWIPAQDPSGLFTGYDIWYGTVANGVYTLLPNPPTAITTNTYLHAGAGGGGYYYVQTKFGTSISVPSDTLRTIFLNILSTAGAPDLQLLFNDLHRPRLPSTAGTYTVEKEYPIGTWKVIGITPLNKYFDTVAVCSASMNFRVRIDDQSLCFSQSNLQGGIYTDQKQPEKPYIDSISVLPDGRTVVAWRIPHDPDIAKYEIQFGNSSQGGSPIDTVNGRASNTYTYSSATASIQSLFLGPKAIDSCGNGSVVDYSASTMLLRTSYDRCGYRTNLTWTPYTLRPDELKEYRVYYSNGGAFQLVGTTSGTTFTHKAVDPASNVTYFVRMVARTGVTSSSSRAGFYSTQVAAPEFVYVAAASVIYNRDVELHLFVDRNKPSTGIEIWRSTDSVSFASIGQVPGVASQAYYTFVDDNVNPSSQRYFYKAVIRDSCGNARTVSQIAGTILLKLSGNEGEIFRQHLSWNPYAAFAGGVSHYLVYRAVNGNFSSSPVATVSALNTEYTDNVEEAASMGAQIVYYVHAVEGRGNPYGLRESASSNEQSVFMEGTLFIPNAFAPHGVNNSWRPVPHFVDLQEYHVMVFDRWGKMVFETRDQLSSWDGAGVESGVYAFVVTFKNSRGEYLERRGSVMVL